MCAWGGWERAPGGFLGGVPGVPGGWLHDQVQETILKFWIFKIVDCNFWNLNLDV